MQDKKLSPEQQLILKQLQQKLSQKKLNSNNQTLTTEKKTKQPVIKHLFNKFLNGLNSLVPLIDSAIKFILKGKSTQDQALPIDQARSPILFGISIIVIFIVGGLIWASIAPLDKASGAIGTVIASSKRKIIQHRDGGIIKEIFIKPGDIIHEGGKIMELDNTQNLGQYNSFLNQYHTLLATENRLIAERDNLEEIEFSNILKQNVDSVEIKKILATQTSIFEFRRRSNNGYYDAENKKIEQNKKQIEGLQAILKGHKKSLSLLKEKIKSVKSLLSEGFAQKTTLMDLESKEATLESEIAKCVTDIAKTEQEISKTEIEILNYRNRFFSELLKELKDTEVQVLDIEQKCFTYKDNLNRSIIRSPVDGIVNDVKYHTIGGIVNPSSEIADITPVKDALLIEAKIPERLIDSVKIGLKAKIKFSAFKSRTTPVFTGRVIALSSDIVTLDAGQTRQMAAQFNNPMLAGNEGGVYIAKIQLDMKKFRKIARSHKLKLYPGMQAEIQIVTGTRTLLRYLLDPLLDQMFKSFKEK